MNAEAMAEHVCELGARHGVLVEEYAGRGVARRLARGSASARQGRGHGGARGRVRVRPVRGVVSYFVALHEIGHCVCRGRAAVRLECEANAWVWAIENAGRRPTASVREAIRRALGGYLDAGQRDRGLRQGMREPDPDHAFWHLLEHGDLEVRR